MAHASAMIAGEPAPRLPQPQDEGRFLWPPPPFHEDAPGAANTDEECELEFADNKKVSGRLLDLRADGGVVTLHSSGGFVERVELSKVRAVRLKQPRAYVANAQTTSSIGASPGSIAELRAFTVTHPDKTNFSGLTRGFLKFGHGLYLFLGREGSSEVTGCFVPRAQLQDVQIGQRLGEALQEKGLLAPANLKAALDRQTLERSRRLGDVLTAERIVSADALTQALKAQARRPSSRLGDLLLESGVVRPEDLQKAIAIQAADRRRRLGDILVEMGLMTARGVQIAESEKLGIPRVNVRDFEIEPAALRVLNGRMAVRHQVLPLLRTSEALVVAVENPLVMGFEAELRFATGLSIVPVIGDPNEIRSRIENEYRKLYSTTNGGQRQGSQARAQRDDPDDTRATELAFQLAEDALAEPLEESSEADVQFTDNTLVRLVNKIIADARTRGASDIHIESNPGRAGTRVRFRLDGDLVDFLELDSRYRSAMVSRLKVMASLDLSERRRAQDGKIHFQRGGEQGIELRMATIPTTDGLEDVVLRLLGGTAPKPLEGLTLSSRDLRELRACAERSYGLLLVCGPTGSGKTTTLHSLLHHINRPDLKIWTAEDPVEITQAGLRQVQVNERIGWTFANALRSFLRADPDVIMVGEMRDSETAKVAVEASLTGHLVLSTLHTNTAAESVTRLLNLGLDRFNFADALLGVMSQRLAKRLCPACKKVRAASDTEIRNLAAEYCAGSSLDPDDVLAEWRKEFGKDGTLALHAATGCPKCTRGYAGRVGIHELLVNSPEIRQLIRDNGSAADLAIAAQSGGMLLLRQDALRKVLGGELDLASARAAFN